MAQAKKAKKQRKHRQRFDAATKAASVERIRQGASAKQIAEELDTNVNTVYHWVSEVNKHRAAPNNAAFDRFEIAMRCIQELNHAPSNEDRLTIIKALERCYTRDA